VVVLFTNLLYEKVGLAVDDIERIASNALLERRRMQVFHLLPTQSFVVWLKGVLPNVLQYLVLPGYRNTSYVESVFTVSTIQPAWKQALIRWGIWYDYAIEEVKT